MITPLFEINQSDIFITVIIHAPFANVNETEVFVDGHDFKFYSKPYFLRLTLPGAVVEDGRESASYDCDTAKFTIAIPKANPGEYFDGLNLLTKLLAPSGETSAKPPKIEVLDGDVTEEADDGSDEETDFDWQIEQEPFSATSLPVDGPKYGFANQRCAVLQRIQSELLEVIDLREPDSTPASERHGLRRINEDQHFCAEHYLADLHESQDIQRIIEYKPYWNDSMAHEKGVEFTVYEKDVLLKLPRKEYLLDSDEKRIVSFGLVDILFAYAYDHRTTEGENTVESGWTIAKLCGTLSWFETYSSLRDVLLSCYRRCLCYPLYRHWQLTQTIAHDVHKVLTLGRRQVVKCLVDVRRLFIATGDQRYVLNDLYIDDYCSWTQHISEKRLKSLADSLSKVEISKQDVGFDIDELELASHIVLSETSDQHHISSEEVSREAANSSETETSSDDDDDDSDDDDDDTDSSSSSSDSFVTDDSAGLTGRDKSDCVGAVTCIDDGKHHPPLTTISDSVLVVENRTTTTTAAAAEPAELVCQQLSSLTVSDEQQVTPVVSDLPQSDIDLPVEH